MPTLQSRLLIMGTVYFIMTYDGSGSVLVDEALPMTNFSRDHTKIEQYLRLLVRESH